MRVDVTGSRAAVVERGRVEGRSAAARCRRGGGRAGGSRGAARRAGGALVARR